MKYLMLIFFALLMSGCGAKFKVDHVTGDQLQESLKTPGVFYMLPKTQLSVTVPVRLFSKQSGDWLLTYANDQTTRDFKKVVAFCDTGLPSGATVSFASPKEASRKLFLGQPQLAKITVPDPEHIYKIDAKFGLFSNFNHTISLAEDGLIKTASSTVTNTSVEAAQFGLDIASRFVGLPDGLGGGKDNRGEGTKPQSTLTKEQQTRCAQVLEVKEHIASKLKDIEDKERAKIGQLKKILSTPKNVSQVNIEVIKAGVAAYDSEISAAKKSLAGDEKYREAFGVEKSQHFSYTGVYEPSSNTSTSLVRKRVAAVSPPEKDLTAADAIGVYEMAIDSSVRKPADIEAILAAQNIVTVAVNRIGMGALMTDTGPNNASGGYRYRIPAQGEIIIKINDNDALHSVMPIAQYGPVASLPSKINGQKADINPSFSTETGALAQVVLGAYPVSTEAALKAFDTANTLRRGLRNTPPDEPSELELIIKDNELLEAKKKNKDLRESLGLE